jgi:long-chain fatty acid transport protein
MRVRILNYLCLAIGWALLAQAAKADAFHYQTVPLGERALGMGGAFTGVGDDPAAVFYNPAGLSQLEDTSLSASLTLNAFDRRTIVRGYRTAEGQVSLKHGSQPTLPLFVSLVKQVGKKRAGRRRHAIALSTLTVDQRRLLFDVQIRTSAAAIASGKAPVFDSFNLEHEESTVWHGLSYSFRLRDGLSIGASGYLSLYRMRYEEEQLNVTTAVLNPDFGTLENPTVSLNTRRTSSDVKNLIGRVGVLYAQPTRAGIVRYGAMFQPPSIEVSGSAKVHERRLLADTLADPGYGTYFDSADGGLRASAPRPWELRLGTSFTPDERFLVAFDASVYGPVASADDPVIAVGAAKRDPILGDTPQAGDLLLTRWHSKLSGNVSLGIEGKIRDVLALRVGFFTDLSAAPSVRKASTAVAPADVHRFGGALSLGLIAGGYDVSIGAAGVMGRGDGQAYDLSPQAGSSGPFFRTEVSDRTLFVFISGAKSAVTKLAKAAYRNLRSRGESAPDAAVQNAGAASDALLPETESQPVDKTSSEGEKP